MRSQYFCSDAKRRQEVANADSGLNGIDYLEVLDQDYIALVGEILASSLRQRTLLLRCFKPLPTIPPEKLDKRNVRIQGGVRVTGVQIEWVEVATAAADLFAAGLIQKEAERDYLLALPDADHVLVVRTDRRGDFSTYWLSLVASANQAGPPVGFDEVLSHVDFSFKVECPSEFDCNVERVCASEPDEQPAVNYLAKDYASFRRLIFDRLSVIMPDWQDRNPADLGVTLVELLAYAGDRLSYFQDAVGAEAYLGTARRRVSVRRHARLLDYRMHDGCNSRVWVTIEVGPGSDGAVLRKVDSITGTPTRLLTRTPGATVVLAEEFEHRWNAHRPEVFELMHDVALYSAHNEIFVYTWGNQECCLPRGATRATLYDDPDARLRLRVGDVIILEERLDPGTGQRADADPRRRHAVRLTRVVPEAGEDNNGGRTPGAIQRDPLAIDGKSQAIVEIEWHATDALPFAICISTAIADQWVENVTAVRGNVVLADHGRTISNEQLKDPSLAARRKFRPRLQEPNVTARVATDETRLRAEPAGNVLGQEPRDALPVIELVDEAEEHWIPRRDLLSSGRFDPHFVVESEADGVAQLRFARVDDLSGRTPAADAVFEATYRVGNGVRGNVGAESIAQLVVQDAASFADIRRVRNPLSAIGGIEPESAQRVRLDAPQAFRSQRRAVTELDYAEMAERHPAVQKAVATRRWTGSWHTMLVTVDRRDGLPVDADFREEVSEHLECFRLLGHDLEVQSPQFVSLHIVMTVCVAPGYFASNVRRALLDRFSSRNAGDDRGFFHPDNFTFGQAVFLSRIIAAAMELPGVQWVDLTDRGDGPNRFRRFGQPPNNEFDSGRIDMGRLEIARLDNDTSLPENGIIQFRMEGGA